MRRLFTILAFVPTLALADDVPANARLLLPVLANVMADYWPQAPEPWTVAGQVEQESCISLTHSKCWSATAELKTSREYGFGLGQLTTAYTATGAVRFNRWMELKAQYPKELGAWQWEDRFNPKYQLLAIMLMDKEGWRKTAQVGAGATVADQWAFTLNTYNGGYSGWTKDRQLCVLTKGCDPKRWFGHMEKYSTKSKTKLAAYGNRSLFEISREYPRNVLEARREKYRSYFDG
jgi:hypothetical protein